jgi:hypothetical protein
MHFRAAWVLICLTLMPLAFAQTDKVPAGTLLVKGAWSSASDATTPVPEAGAVTPEAYVNEYFGIRYPLAADWVEKYKGPPPSDSGYYVLAQIEPGEHYQGASRGSLLIAAHDLFFSPLPADNALQLVTETRDRLGADFKVEQPPSPVRIHDRPFVRFGYVAPASGLHWYVLATELRCHVVQFVYTSRDPALIRKLVGDLERATLPMEGTEIPLCVNDYARGENVIARVEPVLYEHRFSAIPVRVIIDKEGKVKHIHFLSAFPSETKSITDALLQWRFKPYSNSGQPVEIETGIMFGRRQS